MGIFSFKKAHEPADRKTAVSTDATASVSMATENRTLVATENCTLLGRTSRAERTFSR